MENEIEDELEDEVEDEVIFFILLIVSLGEPYSLKCHSRLYIGIFSMKIWEVVHLVLNIPETYHSLNLEFLYESYT